MKQSKSKTASPVILSDEQLVIRCQHELPYQTDSFEKLVNRYKDIVFGKVITMLKNKSEAEDVSQDIFIKVFKGLPAFRQDAKFSTWLYAITVNTCLNHKEKLQRRPWLWYDQEADDEKYHRPEQDLLYIINRSMEQSDTQKMIEKTLSEMNAQSAEVLRLRFFEELEYLEISKRLGIGLSATKMRLKRARAEFVCKYEANVKD
jgi:RNA polymerase sigma-70 factor (ECF subfamily)